MGNGVIPLMMVAMMPMIAATSIGQRGERNAPTNLDYADYQAKYEDDYPVVVPKRAALLFDQLMVELQKVVDNQAKELGGGGGGGSRSFSRSPESRLPSGNSQSLSSMNDQSMKMDLQRRGQAKGRVYWRCYFNAVTCFKRKR